MKSDKKKYGLHDIGGISVDQYFGICPTCQRAARAKRKRGRGKRKKDEKRKKRSSTSTPMGFAPHASAARAKTNSKLILK